MKLALEACELSDWVDHRILDTLASAYAEAGDFETAVAMQEKVIEMLEGLDDDGLREYRDRLKLYQEKKPVRLPPPATAAKA
ncbi:MAG: hypothetical protein QM775_14790 [Pirellulales bacterium]